MENSIAWPKQKLKKKNWKMFKIIFYIFIFKSWGSSKMFFLKELLALKQNNYMIFVTLLKTIIFYKASGLPSICAEFFNSLMCTFTN